jgi:hypothetical protein
LADLQHDSAPRGDHSTIGPAGAGGKLPVLPCSPRQNRLGRLPSHAAGR